MVVMVDPQKEFICMVCGERRPNSVRAFMSYPDPELSLNPDLSVGDRTIHLPYCFDREACKAGAYRASKELNNED